VLNGKGLGQFIQCTKKCTVQIDAAVLRCIVTITENFEQATSSAFLQFKVRAALFADIECGGRIDLMRGIT